MRYDDAARRYNFVAGLGIGAMLGVGLAMLALPQKKVLMRRREEARRSLRKAGMKQRLSRFAAGSGAGKG